MAGNEQPPRCSYCADSAAIGVAYEICLQHAEKRKCDLVKKKLVLGEIKDIRELINEFKKVTPEDAHPLLDEVLEWREEE